MSIAIKPKIKPSVSEKAISAVIEKGGSVEQEGKFIFMPTADKITREDATANVHLTSRHVWHLVGKYSEQLFMLKTLKMKKENPSLSEVQIKNAFRLTPHDFRRRAHSE